MGTQKPGMPAGLRPPAAVAPVPLRATRDEERSEVTRFDTSTRASDPDDTDDETCPDCGESLDWDGSE